MSEPSEPSIHWRPERWRLHRSGFIDVWVYGIQELDTDGGRQILQGPNGSGKSRSLELQLPFCLDGDLHYLGTKGVNTVSMSKLMLDDYTRGQIRIGYCWVELRRVRDGEEEFLTCGVGVRASKSSSEITDAWRFITPRRVGHDLELASAGRAPLDLGELRSVLGEDAVFEKFRDFRTRVASAVYAIEDARRYEDLLHLQRTLRNPDIGVRAAAGQLEDCLSLALPPLDPDMVAQLAGQLQDFEIIGDNIKRLRRAEHSFDRFMSVYTAYTRGVLQQRAATLTAARSQLATHVRVAKEREDEVAKLGGTVERLGSEIEEIEGRVEGLALEIKDMEASDDFRELRAIDQRRQALRARSETVSTYLEFAQTAREAEERACETVLRELTAARRVVEAFRGEAQQGSQKVRAIGLDPGLVPTPPAMADPTRCERVESALLSAEPDATPQPVHRLSPPEVDLAGLVASTRTVVDQVGLAAEAVSGQKSRIEVLLAEGRRLAQMLSGEIARLQFAAEEAHTAKVSAADARDAALPALEAEVEAWDRKHGVWLAEAPSSPVPLAPHPEGLGSLTAADDAIAATGLAQRRLRAWAAPAVEAAREGLQRAATRFDELSMERQRIAEKRQALEEGADIAPPEPPLPRDERVGRGGTPFRRLVDFELGLRGEERGGLEGALQGCGLLDAWVYPDGSLADPGLADLVALAPMSSQEHTPSGRTLSAVLNVVAGNELLVSASVVERILRAVQLGEDTVGRGGLSVSTDGRWRAGNLTGLVSKPYAEFVGEAAREATRARWIAALDEEMKTLVAEIGRVQAALREGAEARRLWEHRLENVPDASVLIRVHAAGVQAEEGYRKAADLARRTAGSRDQALSRWEAQHDVLKRRAADANLPHDVSELARSETAAAHALEACRTLRERGDDVLAALNGLAPGIKGFEKAKLGRESAEHTAAAEHSTYGNEFDAVAALAANLKLDTAKFEERLTRLRDDHKLLSQSIPSREKEKAEAEKQIVRREALMELDASSGIEKEQAVREAERGLLDVVRAPGFWTAATNEAAPADPGYDALLELIARLPDSPVDRESVANGVGQLNNGLPRDLRAEFSSVGDAFAVQVRGVDGLRPVAFEARAVRETLARDQKALDEHYRAIFEEYLLRDLAEHLRRQIDAADALCTRMNAILDAAETSQGVRVQLAWEPSPAIDAETRDALALVKTSLAARTREQDDRLRRALQDRTEAERERHQGSYFKALTHALDYRQWYTFTVKVQDKDGDGKDRNRRFKNLSSGEARFVAYVVLIAAAAAFYDALTEPGADPLRIVLLDEAFERIDDPTITKLLELLADLDMDWIITWPGGSAFSPKIGRMHVYDVLRRKNSRSIALMHTMWDGATPRRQP